MEVYFREMAYIVQYILVNKFLAELNNSMLISHRPLVDFKKCIIQIECYINILISCLY